MKMLKIDDKWSIEYDPQNNDRPMAWFRYDDRHNEYVEHNATTAMFYALLASKAVD